MIKRTTVLFLAIVILLSAGATALAKNENYKYQLLQTLECMQGYGGGDLGLDRSVTRAEFTKMAVALSAQRESVPDSINVSPFIDVTYDKWFTPYIFTGVKSGYLAGYRDGTFKPDQNVTYEEAVTIILRVLGYQDQEFDSAWPYAQIRTAEALGVNENTSLRQGDILNREQTATLLFNMLYAVVPGSAGNHMQSLGYSMYEDAVLIATNNEDVSVRSGEVHTSAGTFKIGASFDYTRVGKRGDLLVYKNEVTGFFTPEAQGITCNIFSVVNNKLVLFREGQIVDYNIDINTTLYYGKSTPTTVGAMLASFSAGDIITLHFDERNKLDYVVYEEAALDGPLVVKDLLWFRAAGINEGAHVVRDGAISSMGSIAANDVVYYSAQLQTVWAYSKKITGIFESAFPNRDQVSQITVSGVSYSLDSVAAYVAFSSGGPFRINDRVTLILGRDGKVVDAVSSTAGTESYVVYQVVGNNIVVYSGGVMSTLSLNNTDTAYFKGTATTVGTIKSQLGIGYTIDILRDSDGAVDYVTVAEAQIDGPYTVRGASWTSSYGISDNAVVMRGGAKVSTADVMTHDIVYYSKTLNTVWVYSERVTGVYQSASPNKETPNTVTISGKTYAIEGAGAYNALSSNGQYAYGDTVTLLLGKDGGAADVLSAQDAGESVVGYLVDTGTKEYTDTVGNVYSSAYIQVATTDGSLNEYSAVQVYSNEYKNKAVRISFDGGKAKITTLSGGFSITGVFNYANMTIGNTKIDRNVEILDVIQGGVLDVPLYCKVYAQRLSDVRFDTNSIIYYETKNGAITKMVLNNVTGDACSYGIVTRAESNSGGFSVSGSYTYFDGTVLKSSSTNGSAFSIYSGNPVQIRSSQSKLSSLVRLNEYGRVTEVSGTTVTVGNAKYELAASVCVYRNTVDYEYQAMTITELIENQSTYSSITAYYDKTAEGGGRVRVLLVK